MRLLCAHLAVLSSDFEGRANRTLRMCRTPGMRIRMLLAAALAIVALLAAGCGGYGGGDGGSKTPDSGTTTSEGKGY